MAASQEFRLRDVRMYRPYRDEIPWDLLGDAGSPVEDGAHMRVAKLHGEVIGVYVICAQSAMSFRLHALVVAESFRRRGLGRWLMGHAIGLAESKGGRELVVDAAAGAPAFFESMGFVAMDGDWKLAFTPE